MPPWAGFVFLAVVLDVFSRRIPAFAGTGWAMADHLRTERVLDALNMAATQRRPEAVIHHCDPGTQYTSLAFGKRCREMGVRPSTGSVGDCYDNAMAESFFATLECELIDRKSLRTRAEAKMALFDFIEGWYNPRRRHSALGYLSHFSEMRFTFTLVVIPRHPRESGAGTHFNRPVIPAKAGIHFGQRIPKLELEMMAEVSCVRARASPGGGPAG